MKRKSYLYSILSVVLFLMFMLFTAFVSLFDVKPIGPQGTFVGLASINQAVLDMLGIHEAWYIITEWLGVTAILVAVGFACVGAWQLLTRRSIRKVDGSLLVLAGFYTLVISAYLLFEWVVINYRPVMLGADLEASYPSSHTMVVVCIMATAGSQFRLLWPGKVKACGILNIVTTVIAAVTVLGRLFSGVHWFTDIVGGLLLAAALVTLYDAGICYLQEYTAQTQA